MSDASGCIREKVEYKEGDKVYFNIDGVHRGKGIIRGKAMIHIIDFWIVEVEGWEVQPENYPYSCVTMAHPAIYPRSGT